MTFRKVLKITLCALIITGALNWGLVGLFDFDLVAFLFGEMTLISRIIYAIIGLSAILALSCCWLFGGCKNKNCDC